MAPTMSITTALLAINREVDVYIAMAQGRDLASGLGFNSVDRTKLEIMILELSRNILHHAGGTGELLVESVYDGTRHGVLVTARDTGPGISDISRALQDGFSTAGTLGAGLPGVKRLADDFQIDSQPGRGTVVRAWKWPSSNSRGRQ